MKYCNGMMYTIKEGDTLYAISMKYQVPLSVLLRANPYVDVYNLQVGETICVPVRRNDNDCQYPENGTCSTGINGIEAEKDNMNMGEMTDMPGMMGNSEGSALWVKKGEEPRDKDSKDDKDDEKRRNIEKNMNMPSENRMMWERYVIQPGDTLDVVAGVENGMDAAEKMERVRSFIEKNRPESIYLLPGIAYHRGRNK